MASISLEQWQRNQTEQDGGEIIPIQNDALHVALVTLPRAEAALDTARTPQEASEVRAQIETLRTYLRRELPRAAASRDQCYEAMFRANQLYLEACRKHGILWLACENKRKPGGDTGRNQHGEWHSQNFVNGISTADAGFRSPYDATLCTRLAGLHDEDLRTYLDDTRENGRQPTLSGAERVWQMLHKAETLPSKPEWQTVCQDVACQVLTARVNPEQGRIQLSIMIERADLPITTGEYRLSLSILTGGD